jgi:hypothetical protein
MKEITLDLLCELDDNELRDRGQTLSSTMLQYDTVEEAKKAAGKEFSEELKGLRGEMRKLSVNIRRKAETRSVLCIQEFHSPTVGTKRITRLDTGEFVRDEPMTSQEHHNNLFEEKSPAKEGRVN